MRQPRNYGEALAKLFSHGGYGFRTDNLLSKRKTERLVVRCDSPEDLTLTLFESRVICPLNSIFADGYNGVQESPSFPDFDLKYLVFGQMG